MRRVVTGLIDGRSQVVSDDDLAEFEIVPGLGITARQIWRDDRTPVVPTTAGAPRPATDRFPRQEGSTSGS
jgi:hypothetical protein